MENALVSYHSVSLSKDKVTILKNVNLNIQKGEFHVILGGNGSGKSSLMKLLCGVYTYGQYSGDILYDGKMIHFHSPLDALKEGIVTLHQETYLYEKLSVAENLFSIYQGLPQTLQKLSKIQKIKMANEFFLEWGVNLDANKRVKDINLGERRILEIMRLVYLKPKLLIMDEPLACLDDSFNEIFNRLLSQLLDNGTTVLYITHRLEEIIDFTDMISILKDGEVVSTFSTQNIEKEEIYDLLWKNLNSNRYPKITVKRGQEVFCVEHLSNGNSLQDISFTLFKGEILGITGVIGAGKSMLAKTLFGLVPACKGKTYIDRLEVKITSPQDAIALGVAYITDERINAGLFMNQSSLENVFSLGPVSSRGILRETKFEYQQFKKYRDRLNLSVDALHHPEVLSGGEQQKLLLMRWFMTPSKIFIFDEPTSSLDLASKIDTYNLINDLIIKDAAIIICSSDLEELTGICDRILILNNGRITYEADRNNKEQFDNIYHHLDL